MNIVPFKRTSSPANMALSALTQAPNFQLKTKKFGFENGFFVGGSRMTVGDLKAKGQNLFAEGATKNEEMLVVTSNMMQSYFGTNESAYARGKALGTSSKYIVCDFENEYGDYGDPTNVDRLGHFLKGVKEAGALAGEFLYRVWNDVNVWDEEAKSQLNNPQVKGIGDKTVPSMGVKLSTLYSFNKLIGYGVNYRNGRKDYDPRSSIYNYVYKLRVHEQMKKKGLVSPDCETIGFLWGGCDGFGAGKPSIKHRIYLTGNLSGYMNIENYDEESLSVMKGFGTWAFSEGNGIYYWDSRIPRSDNKNDVVDILYSGFTGGAQYVGSGSLPGSRPSPVRSYPFLDGLSREVVYEAAHEISKVEDTLDGEFSDADYAFKVGTEASFTDVVKPVDGTGIVDDYTLERPIVTKYVKGKKVLFIIQNPGARQGEITKLKLSHSSKTWLVSVNSDEPKLFQFNF